MALTKVSRGLLSTGIVDNSNATAVTLNADESATFAGAISVTGALTVDTNTFVVDATNNRVGIGTSSPSSILSTSGTDTTAYSSSSVGGQDSSATLKIQNLTTGANTFASIDFNTNNNRVVNRIVSSHGSTTTNGFLAFVTEGAGTPAERMRIDSSGNVGIGCTPASKLDIDISTDARGSFSSGIGEVGSGNFALQVTNSAGSALKPLGFRAEDIRFATGSAERMRIDSSGNVKIGDSATDITSKLVVSGNASADVATFMYDGAAGTFLDIDCGAANGAVTIAADARSGSYPPLTFKTAATERIRLTSGGSFQAKGSETNYISNSEYHQFAANIASIAMYVFNANTASGSAGILINVANESSNANGYFIRGYSNSTARDNVYIYTNGDVSNRNGTYSQFSDVKLKQDISDANNQWQDFKSIQFRKYRFKDDVASDENAPYHLGVVAQELEAAGLNGLVTKSPDKEFYESPVTDDDGNAVLDEDGNAVTEQQERLTGETTKSVKMSILYAKGMVALQEAMARIETLEAKVQTLENN